MVSCNRPQWHDRKCGERLPDYFDGLHRNRYFEWLFRNPDFIPDRQPFSIRNALYFERNV